MMLLLLFTEKELAVSKLLRNLWDLLWLYKEKILFDIHFSLSQLEIPVEKVVVDELFSFINVLLKKCL